MQTILPLVWEGNFRETISHNWEGHQKVPEDFSQVRNPHSKYSKLGDTDGKGNLDLLLEDINLKGDVEFSMCISGKIRIDSGRG